MDVPSTEHSLNHFSARTLSRTIVVVRDEFDWNINVFRAMMNTPYLGSNDRASFICYLPEFGCEQLTLRLPD